MRSFVRQAVATVVLPAAFLLESTVVFGVEANPYSDIVTRNAFGLRPPEPPKAPEPVKEEAAPSNIFLTGVTSIGGKKQVYLKLVTPGEKDPEYLRLGENERQGAIEVTEIIPKTGRVRIKNRGVPSIISFETHGVKTAVANAAAPAVPGVPGRPAVMPTVPGSPASPAGVTVNNPPPTTSTLRVSPNNSAVGGTVRPSGGLTPTSNQAPPTRSIPSRPLRLNPSGGGASYQAPSAPNIDPVVQAVQIEVNRQVQPDTFPPLPPTSR